MNMNTRIYYFRYILPITRQYSAKLIVLGALQIAEIVLHIQCLCYFEEDNKFDSVDFEVAGILNCFV